MINEIARKNVIWSELEDYWVRDYVDWYCNEYDYDPNLSKKELYNLANEAYHKRDKISEDFSLNLENLDKIYNYTSQINTPYTILAICEVVIKGKKRLKPITLGANLGLIFCYNHNEEILQGLGYAYVPHWYVHYNNIYCYAQLALEGMENCQFTNVIYKGLKPGLSLEEQEKFLTLLEKHNFENNLTSSEWSKYTLPLRDLINKKGEYLWGKPLY